MRLFQSESRYNVKTGEWEEYFWIDGQEVDCDSYFFELEREKDLEIAKLKEAVEIEDDDFCDCPNCTILKYVEIIQEMTGGCPHCLEEILTDFMIDIVNHIVLDDEEIEEETYVENKDLN